MGLSFGMTDLSGNYISPKHGRQHKWVVTRFDKKTQNGEDSFIRRRRWRSQSFQRKENKDGKLQSVNETCYLNMIKDNNMISDVKLCSKPLSACFFSSSKCEDKQVFFVLTLLQKHTPHLMCIQSKLILYKYIHITPVIPWKFSL